MAPFTGDGLAEIKVRSKGRSELSGRTDRPLHCMHFNHRRGESYNKPESGMRVTVIEHLAYHIYYQDNAEEIGLKECQNDFAIDMLNREAVTFMDKIGKLDEMESELCDATLMWEQVLENM